MRLEPLPDSAYSLRISRLQQQLQENGLDLFVGYSSECESATSRYLTGFWPFFDFDLVLVPAQGRAALVTGGPESFEFAQAFAQAVDIYINPLLVETSAPDWVPEVEGRSMAQIIDKVLGRIPQRIGIGNGNIFPYVLRKEIEDAFPQAQMVSADQLLLKVQAIKDDQEIPYIEKAYQITEQSLMAALDIARPGIKEWELEAAARSAMVLAGAEGTPYPNWVCSGPHTTLSLCRSTDRAIGQNELVQLTIGAKYMGYCGNMCRPFALGQFPAKAKDMAKVALESIEYVLDTVKHAADFAVLVAVLH